MPTVQEQARKRYEGLMPVSLLNFLESARGCVGGRVVFCSNTARACSPMLRMHIWRFVGVSRIYRGLVGVPKRKL